MKLTRDEKKKLKLISDRLQDAENSRSEYESATDGWERAYDNYMSKPPTDVPRHRNNLFSPKSFAVVETWFPLVFSDPPKFTPKRVRRGDFEQAKIVRNLVQYYMNTGEVRLRFEDFLRSAAIYGTGILKHYWSFAEVEAVERDTIEDPDNPYAKLIIPVDVRTAVKDQPMFDVIDIMNFYVAPNATSMFDAEWVIEKRIVKKAWIKEMIDAGLFSLPKGMTMADLGDEVHHDTDSVGWVNDKVGSSNTDNTKGIQIYEYWTNTGEWCVTVKNRFFLYNGKNPFDHAKIPYLTLRINRPPNEFYGQGLLLPILSSQEEINKIKSQRRDNIELAVQTIFKVKQGSPADMLDLVFKAGAKIPVNDSDDITQLNMNDVTQVAVQEIGIVQEEIKNALGIHEYIQGAVQDGMNKTASGTAQMMNAAMGRIMRDVKLLEIEVLAPLAEAFHSLAKQFMTDPMPILLMEEGDFQQAQEIYPEQIQCDIDFEVLSGSTSPTNKELRIQQATTLLNIGTMPTVSQALAMNGQKVDAAFLFNIILDQMDVKSKDKAIVPMNEMDQQLWAMQMMGGMPAGTPQGGQQ